MKKLDSKKYVTAHPEAERLERKIRKSASHPMTVALQAAIARNWEKIRQHKPHLAIKPSPPTTHSQSPVMGLFY